MRTLTLVCNLMLLGLVGIGILTNSLTHDTVTRFLMGTAAIMNIVLIAGSTTRTEMAVSGANSISEGRSKRWSLNLLLKILAIILNAIFLVIVIVEFKNASGSALLIFMAYLILTLVLSAVRVAIGRWNGFSGMIKPIFSAGFIVTFLFLATVIVFRIMIGNAIKENISIAKKEFPGKAEDALLAYLADSTKSPRDRTEIAVWTLGQIRSRKALPVLKALYRNDPKGLTCRHNSEICQYGIHKAIVSIESKWLGAREKNVFGSWARLNK